MRYMLVPLPVRMPVGLPRSSSLSSHGIWKALAEILESEGLLYGLPSATLNRLNLVAEGKAVAVVTGQQ